MVKTRAMETRQGAKKRKNRSEGDEHDTYQPPLRRKILRAVAEGARVGDKERRRGSGGKKVTKGGREIPKVPHHLLDKDFKDVAYKAQLSQDDLKSLYLELGISAADVENAERKAGTRNFKLQAVEVLKSWRSSQGTQATRKLLLEAMGNCDLVLAKEILEKKWATNFEDKGAGPSTATGEDGVYHDAVEYLADDDGPCLSGVFTSSPSKQMRLVLVGHTGGGKSATGNSILCERNTFKSVSCFSSVTTDCQKSSGKDMRHSSNRSGNSSEIVVVDTPGLFDTSADPDDIAKEITQCILHSRPGPHAILLVLRVDQRMTNEVLEAVDGVRKLFGDESLRYMIVIFTHLDAIKKEKGFRDIEQYIGKNRPPALVRILQQCNNRFVAFDNTLDPESDDNKDQVSDLLDLVDSVVESNGGGCYTNDLLEEANRLMEVERKMLESKFKDRETKIRADYDEQLTLIDAKQRELDDVKRRIDEQKDEHFQEVQMRVEVLKTEINEKEGELKAMSTNMKRALKRKEGELDRLKTNLNVAKADKTRSNAEKKNLQKRENQLKKDKKKIEKNLSELSAQNAALATEKESELADKEEELRRLRTNLKKAIAKVTKREAEKRNLEDLRQELEEDLSDANDKKDSFETYLSDLETEFERETKESIPTIDPSNSPKNVVEGIMKAVKKSMEKCKSGSCIIV